MEFKKLTKEDYAEAKKCKTEEEKREFLKKHQGILTDDELNEAVGGSGTFLYTCNKCGASFEDFTDLAYHAFWDHVIGD